MSVTFGIDQWLAARAPGGRFGLVTNDAARPAETPDVPSRVALLRAGLGLVRLFSPEHGLTARAPDGAAVTDGTDAMTGLPIVSLYGETLRPPPATLADLDGVLFDIPDIGARFYTYMWTLYHVREACASAGVPLVVLDRPNPLGGELAAAEGPILEVAKLGSFLGRAAIPIRHALTLGELAQLWNREAAGRADLRVIPCAGWRRAMLWPDTGRAFVPTSPAITSFASALLYPGICLFEGTNLSAGRGTAASFQAVGAPWLRAAETAQAFNARGLPGVTAHAETFTPTMAPHAGTLCATVRLEVTDARAFRPVGAGLHLLAAVLALNRQEFGWARYPTAANPGGEGHFERLIGRVGVREALEAGTPDLEERVREWTAVPGWAERVRGDLLYE